MRKLVLIQFPIYAWKVVERRRRRLEKDYGYEKHITGLERHVNRLLREKCPAPGGHVFKPTGIIFELVRDIIGTHCLTKFHEDWTINVASRVLKRKNAPPPGDHVV
ncbi:hypothetical protein DPMN_095240 [Dreissena polymorpha]|uniref:Uncharacterized protein n=1 Tax=Dreissena polymorpha TaxID=45954 RepID=A0A9D4L702_DREPO|nr:hypothetical protein DPMN_095240 [Dreissena polymorpha]